MHQHGISPQDISRQLEDYLTFIINSGNLGIRIAEPGDDKDKDKD